MPFWDTVTSPMRYLTDKLRSPNAVRIQLGKTDSPQKESERVTYSRRMYDYYINDQVQIKIHLRRSMGRLFKQRTIDKMIIPYLNIIKRILNRSCLVYKLPAERYVVVPKTAQGDNIVVDEKMQGAHDNYQLLLEGSNVNAKSKEWHRQAKFFDTVYVLAVWRDNHLEYDIFSPHQLTVTEDPKNYLEAATVKYKTCSAGIDRYYVWSVDEHWVLGGDDKPIEGENLWNGVNKYGIIPLIPLRLRETENHWGRGDTQLVDINQKINILLASGYYNAIMQAHGQLVGINTKLKDEIRLGPDSIIQVDNMSSDQTIDIKYIHPEAALKETTDMIDWLLRTAAMMRGLSASSVSIDVKAESGAAKAIDNWELLEQREDDIEWLRVFEKRLFEVSRVVWNFNVPASQKIDEDAQFGIDFAKPESPMSKDEEIKYKKELMSLGLWTPVDDMVDEDEGIDRETAKVMIQENVQIMEDLKFQFGTGTVQLQLAGVANPQSPDMDKKDDNGGS